MAVLICKNCYYHVCIGIVLILLFRHVANVPETCPSGYYGTQCTNKCNCFNCDKNTGSCASQTCFVGFWGDNCEMQCSTNCITCDKVTGCMNSNCYNRFWGPNCDDQCSNNCINCNKLTGCSNCFTGFWGENCETPCPSNCVSCDETTWCTNSQCRLGYWGENCETPCPTFCVSCDETTGCTNSQCKFGYWGENCETPCPSTCISCDKTAGCTNSQCRFDYWGENCETPCPFSCESCDKTAGCTNSQCKFGYWGKNCETQCSFYCNSCLKSTGCNGFEIQSTSNIPQLTTKSERQITAGTSLGLHEIKITRTMSPTRIASASRWSTAGIAGGASVAVIVILGLVIVIVVLIMKRRGSENRIRQVQRKDGDNNFHNQAFSPDLDACDDADLDEQGYEKVTSSKWKIVWKDIYLSENILGKGNFGEVQLGKVRIKDNDMWINAAVKTLKKGTPESERALFKKEFDIMTRIGYHPNVVNTLGSCEHKGSFYVILEYVHHGNLRKFLRKCRKEQTAPGINTKTDLSPKQLMNFALGVAKAMDHISSCGIIHRDLAARNILVGRGLTPKVADFGMSREEDIYVQTSFRRVPTRWLSIESITQKTYSTKTDVWSFGILLWEIATFGGTPYPDMETKHLSYHLTSGHRMARPDSCEHEVYQLMLQCWQEDPDARPSFKNIVDILSDLASQEKIYMSTHFYENFKYAVISLDKDDK